MEDLELKEILKRLWNNRIIIISIIFIFVAIGYAYSFYYVTPKYTSSTTLLLVSVSDDSKSSNSSDSTMATDLTINSKLVSTYSELIKSKTVLRKVLSNLDIYNMEENTLKKNITVSSVTNTELIKISVTDNNSKSAADIANQIAVVFSDEVKQIYKINNVYVVDKAEQEEKPSNINHVKDLEIFLIIGLIVSAMYVFIQMLTDTRIKLESDIEKQYSLPVLASIPIDYNKNKKDDNELITFLDPKAPISETFRTLRTNIQFMNINKKMKTLLVTSTLPGEGKSWVGANLSIAFAQIGKKVILIDADMRKGRQASIFGLGNNYGLSNYLIEESTNSNLTVKKMEKYIKETPISNLYVMTAGIIPPNPSELLVSEQMADLLAKLEKIFDIIIIDGTPCELVTDSVILSRCADSTVIVTAYDMTNKDILGKTLKNIQNVNGKVIGSILNKIPKGKKKYKQSYYYGNDNSKNKKKELKRRAEKLMNETEKNDDEKQKISGKHYHKRSQRIDEDYRGDNEKNEIDSNVYYDIKEKINNKVELKNGDVNRINDIIEKFNKTYEEQNKD